MAFAVFWLAAITLLNILGVDAGKWLNNIGALGSLLPLTVLHPAGRGLVLALWAGDVM